MKAPIQALLGRLAALNPDHRRIVVGATWVAAFVLIAKLAAAGRDMAIAWRYGVGEVVDAYQLAVTLVFWLPSTVVAALLTVLVPMLVRIHNRSSVERQDFLMELRGSAILAGFLCGLAAVLVEPLAVPYLAGKLSDTSQKFVWSFTLGMAPAAPLVLLTGLYAARLMSRERQLNTLLEGLPPAAILFFCLLWPVGADVGPLLWGTLLGMVVQTVWLSQLARQLDSDTSRLRFSRRSPHWRDLNAAMSVMVAGQVGMGLITPLDQFTAAQLGDGAIATLGYASRVVSLFLGLGALAFSRAALPVMTSLHSAGQSARAYELSMRWTILMLGLGLLTASISWVFAPWGIAVLFERGAFTAQDTDLVTQVFRWAVIQMPFYFAGLVLVQLLASQGRYTIIAAFGASNLLVKFALNLALSAWMGIPGIAFATALMYAWSAGCLYWAATRSKGSQ